MYLKKCLFSNVNYPQHIYKTCGKLWYNLCGKQVKYLQVKTSVTQLIIGEHVQLLRYESFCLITNSLLSGLWDGVGISTLSGQYDIHP